MPTINENLEALRTAKTSIKNAYQVKGINVTNVPFTEYGQLLNDFKIKGESNFMAYLVNYVQQEDGTYEMRITDYVEGAEGDKVLIGTIDRNDEILMDLYMHE